ncbi:MAG: PPC domain-containing protein [Actinobacteria bacterium]|nr:PPC domain-containing protein [Actinomycetota bacterium]
MRKILLIALMTVPMFISSALAAPLPTIDDSREAAPVPAATVASQEETLMKPIISLGSEDPGITVVSPAHLPVPSGSSGLGPGTQILISRPDGRFLCTANFIWSSTTSSTPGKSTGKGQGKGKAPTTTTTTDYLGAAGHCFIPGDLSSTHGTDADYDASETTVFACVADCDFGGQMGGLTRSLRLRGEWVQLGALVYARQDREGAAPGHDFGIVHVPESLSSQIRPEMPVWGGPSGIEEVSKGRSLCLYGNAVGLGEVFPTKARAGVGRGLDPEGIYWEAVLPSLPGDSGSAIVTCGPDSDGLHGQGAAGILTHLRLGSRTRLLGTTMVQAARMTQRDAGISIQPMLEDYSTADPGPPPPPPADETIAVGSGEYTWTTGRFTRAEGAVNSIVDGDACSAWGTDHCDREYIQVQVPEGGATLNVTVSTKDPTADFDLYVFGPDGEEVGNSAHEFTPPESISKAVTAPGLYTIAVNPWVVVNASYTGTASLTPLEPPAEVPFDGEISVGGSVYEWEGDPPLDANPGFFCTGAGELLCDVERIKVNVPATGGTISVAVNSAGGVFRFEVYDPSGNRIILANGGGTSPPATAQVTETGVYVVAVRAPLAPLEKYFGKASIS